MQNKYVYFLILHYGSELITEECVDSILMLSNREAIKIIIVDNASNNGSYDKLHARYSMIKFIEILQISSGKGFSYGNNYGYSYIREKKDAAFIIVCNNDIVFVQRDCINRLFKLYEDTNFFIAGPDIYNPGRKLHQNPFKYDIATREQVEKDIGVVKRELKYIDVAILRDSLVEKASKCILFSTIRKTRHKYDANNRENVCIHGSCIIVSDNFISSSEVLFYPQTVFYCEEEILSYRCKKNRWKIIYSPSIKVEHRESSATKQKFNDYRKRRTFMLNRTLESLEILESYIKENENL